MSLLHAKVRHVLTAFTVIGATAAASLAVSPPASAETDPCAAMTASISHVLRPRTGGDLLTTSASEATGAQQYGYTTVLQPVKASTSAVPGLTSVHRLYSSKSYDFTWALEGSPQMASALSSGYADQGQNFYAAATPLPGCSQPMQTYVKGGIHRVAGSTDGAGLNSAGWTLLGLAFYTSGGDAVVPPPPPPPPPGPATDTTFSFAVMPDTQNEGGDTDQRMPKRVSWLINNKEALDLRWVLHSGDLQNWDTADHYQYRNNSARLAPLSQAGLPFMAAVGNHDTAAVCPGGSACPGVSANVSVRDTTTWNAYYPPGFMGMQGVFEAGKSDNGWRSFQAGGLSWLVLDLELWPRPSVITWARDVVASHPRHNVILLTHSFLEADGSLSTSNGGYGATAPSTLWAALDDYPNVVMSFSGHVGAATETNLTGADGHRMAAHLQALHAPDNPVRIVRVDTATGTITSDIHVSYDPTLPAGQQNVDKVQTQYSSTVSGMTWVR